jgi:hypothetical protein
MTPALLVRRLTSADLIQGLDRKAVVILPTQELHDMP